ncbi:MAG: hypothetical protein J0I47_11270 [Sphingomonas sp.]|uniref:ArnT family glycosyltransferase n=1 Tax=Sphingomonas sp. TaxID=28214 RepID=UPI001AC7233C|nr:hypothetical protein [Sphingomonas sp.]MBN8808793.1 hypothetical protein [Sphingomonas sp.]
MIAGARAIRDAVAQPRGWRVAMVALMVAALIVRLHYIGDPLIDSDEQFYLLVGDRMWHGAVPYMDIWDRKPVGLFLLYAAIRLLGGDGIVQYQLVATAFAGATAVVIAILARRIAPPWTAIVVGLLYLLSLNLSGGPGGQAPVFYNLPVAVAAWIAVRTLDGAPERIVRRGAVAMLLVGIALQIKYSVLVEGIYFGLAFSWMAWRAKLPMPRLAVAMTLWVVAALAPTALAFAWYAAIGHAGDFVFANFTSIGDRGQYRHELGELGKIGPRMLPFLLPIALSLTRRPWRGATSGAAWLLLAGWGLTATLSFAGFGSYFNHYALPLLVPFAVLAAVGFAVDRAGPILAVVAVTALVAVNTKESTEYGSYFGDAAYAARVTAAIDANLHGGTLYVYFGDPIYYQLTQSPLPSRWAFPYHLSLTREQPALGVDAMAELKRVLDSRPAVILDRTLYDDNRDPQADALLFAHLHRDYRLAGTFPLREDGTRVWALRRD